MAYRLTEAEDTVDAVLQGVLDDTQQWADTAQASFTGHKQQEAYTLSELQPTHGTEQAPQAQLAGTGQQQLTVSAARTALDAPSQLPHVMSAMNPLFLPAKPSRPQSGLLQRTLSAMGQQLAALEHSMQQLPDEDAIGTPAGPLSAPSAEAITTADSSQQQRAFSEAFLRAACSSHGNIGIVQTARSASHCSILISVPDLIRMSAGKPCTGSFRGTAMSKHVLFTGEAVSTAAEAPNTAAVLCPDASMSTNSASAAQASAPEAEHDLPVDKAEDSTLQYVASPPSDTAATAADSPPTAVHQPGTPAEAPSTADSTVAEHWPPSPPLIPAARPVAPRRTGFLQHSMSAMPTATQLGRYKHRVASALDGHHMSAVQCAQPKVGSTLAQASDASVTEHGAELQCSSSRQGMLRRPATAGQARTETAFSPQWALGVQTSRPQTAAAADRCWRSVR